MENVELEMQLRREWGLEEVNKTNEDIRNLLAQRINQLINGDFHRLIATLYRIDVDEAQLKKLLQDYPTMDAGGLIADLVIERQLQKNKSRQEFRQRDQDIDESEKW